MSFRATLLPVLAVTATGVLLYVFLERQLAAAWFAFGSHPDVLAALEGSLDDQKALAAVDPAGAESYRRRFDELERLLHRLQILEHSRDRIVRRQHLLLSAAFGVALVLAVGGSIYRQGRDEARLRRLQDALTELGSGSTAVETGERRRDTIGRIARMVERTSQRIAADQRRIAALENLSSWQEAARRHAHEMRTPLTGARMELERLRDGAEEEATRQRVDSAVAELERLGRFAERFTSFARLPAPRLETRDVGAFVASFADTFEAAWLNLSLEPQPVDEPTFALCDGELLRQVLVNLCDNSSLAAGERRGTVTFRIDGDPRYVRLEVADDGPGVPAAIRSRLFDPYTTTRSPGRGMGLGLAISRKILLEHGGDLELATTSEAGAAFRLTLVRAPEPPP